MKTVTVKNGSEIAISDGDSRCKKVLHSIFILDASGSMNSGGYQRHSTFGITNTITTNTTKYQTAINGINREIDVLRENKEVDSRVSVYEFDSIARDTERITEHYYCAPIDSVKSITGRGASGNTPLYQTIAYVIDKFLRCAKNDEQVLISIYTDGAHNCPWGKYGTDKACKALIKDVQDNRNFAITFIGTEQDTQHAIYSLGINTGNTISYDGTSADLDRSMLHSTKSRAVYLNTYAKGTVDNTTLYS